MIKAGSEITGEEALKHLSPETLSACYLIYGEEPFFVDRTLAWFREQAIDPAVSLFNYNRFEADRVMPDEVLLMARTCPMASPRRLIIIENADKITDPNELFLSYLQNPSATTILVFVAQKPDMRTRFFIALKTSATRIHCRPLYENEVARFIQQEAKKKGLRFTEEAALYFKEHLGKDLFRIQKELEKLSLHPAPNNGVSLAMVQQMIAGERNHSIFELLNALGEKDIKKALSLLIFLLEGGEPPLMILAMLIRQFRMMASAKERLTQESESVVGKTVPIPPYRVAEFLRQLRLWKKEEIRQAFDLFRAVDLQLKGGRLAASIVMERLMLKLCQSELAP